MFDNITLFDKWAKYMGHACNSQEIPLDGDKKWWFKKFYVSLYININVILWYVTMHLHDVKTPVNMFSFPQFSPLENNFNSE